MYYLIVIVISLINKIQNGLIHKDFNKYFEDYNKEWLKNLFSIYKIEFETKYNWDILIRTNDTIFFLEYKKGYWKEEKKYITEIFYRYI